MFFYLYLMVIKGCYCKPLSTWPCNWSAWDLVQNLGNDQESLSVNIEHLITRKIVMSQLFLLHFKVFQFSFASENITEVFFQYESTSWFCRETVKLFAAGVHGCFCAKLMQPGQKPELTKTPRTEGRSHFPECQPCLLGFSCPVKRHESQ